MLLARDLLERDDVSQARMSRFVASVCRVWSVGLRLGFGGRQGWDQVTATLLGSCFETFVFHGEVSVWDMDGAKRVRDSSK